MNKNKNTSRPIVNTGNKKPDPIDDDIIMDTEQFIGTTFDNLNNVILAYDEKNKKLTGELLAYKKAFESQKFKIDEMNQRSRLDQEELEKNKLHNINKRANRENISKKLDSLYKIKDKAREEDILRKADELYEKLMRGESI